MMQASTTLVIIFGVFRTFGEGCPKVYIIWAVMQLSHFLGYRSNHFFNLMS
jgi:hypothetical protein